MEGKLLSPGDASPRRAALAPLPVSSGETQWKLAAFGGIIWMKRFALSLRCWSAYACDRPHPDQAVCHSNQSARLLLWSASEGHPLEASSLQ